MRPSQTSSPLAALAAALLPALEPDQGETQRLTLLGQLSTLLRDGRLPEVIDRILARAGAQKLLLVVDQFEELFAREPAEVERVERALADAAFSCREDNLVGPGYVPANHAQRVRRAS